MFLQFVRDMAKMVRTPKLEKLEDDLIESGMKVNKHFTFLELLKSDELQMQKEVASLQGPSITCGKQPVLEKIINTSHSAAVVVCKMPQDELRRQGIVGVVALLGTVENIELSRMLAKYLGEDQMLAIVCRNHLASFSKFTTDHGLSINGGYLAICLEDIRPSIDPLQPPTLPNGITPPGFLGYAVNLINIKPNQHWRTKSGHGLRETLFYSLFGGLQVYQNRECMMAAHACSCIKAGAVSLDGGMIRGNGIICLANWEEKILFPVKMTSWSLVNMRRMERLEEGERELVKIKQRIDVEGEALRRASEELATCRDKYNIYKPQEQAESVTTKISSPDCEPMKESLAHGRPKRYIHQPSRFNDFKMG